MAALDLLGRRWTLRVLWELHLDTHTFRSLQDACEGVSPTVLNTRLRELRQAELVERSDEGYRLSGPGRELMASLAPLERWAGRWARRLAEGTKRSETA
jgi:DNA-binding HxlR family transcriptional regulator